MFAGIDIGSVTTKAVLIDEDEQVIAFACQPTSSDRQESGDLILAEVCRKAATTTDSIKYTVSTGYGQRIFTGSNYALPEIICLGKGAISLYPKARVVIDIGGRGSQVIEMDESGRPLKHNVNERCAAGTGRFLEVLADTLNVRLAALGEMSLEAKSPCKLKSTCTVFAETEVSALLAAGRSRANIAAGMHLTIAKRVLGMGTSIQIRYRELVIISGGVARNTGVVKAIRDLLRCRVVVLQEPQITAALGAAIFATERSR